MADLLLVAQNQPQQYGQQRQETVTGNDMRDGTYEEEGEEENATSESSEQPAFGLRDPQPFVPRDANFFGQGEQPRSNEQPRAHQNGEESVERLPSFITGAGSPPQEAAFDAGNGAEQTRFQGDRQERPGGFRRRRRHRPNFRGDAPGGAPAHDDGGDAPSS